MAQAKIETAPRSYTEIFNDLFSEDQQKQALAQAELQTRLNAEYKKSPGFFTPYRSFSEFGTGLTAPIVAPTVLGLIAGVTALVAAVGTLATVGSLFVSGGAAFGGLFTKNYETAEDALVAAAFAGIITAVAALATVALTVLAAVSIPYALTALVTRSVSTVVSAVSDCFSKCCSKEADEENIETEHLVTATM
jgi:hypothetical protein